MFVRPGPRLDPQVQQALPALDDHQVVLEDFHTFQEYVGPVRNHLLPGSHLRAGNRRFHQPEILRAQIRADEEMVAVVIHLVFMVALARREDPKFALRIVGLHIAVLGAQRLIRDDHQVLLRLGLEDKAIEGRILFFVDQSVGSGARSQNMLVDLVNPQRGRVLAGVKDRLVIVGPGDIRGDVGDDVPGKVLRVVRFLKRMV